MKTRNLALIVVALIATWSCSSPAPSGEVTVTRQEINAEVEKTVANLNIEGMTCAEGCGGKIQKELRTIAGVNDTHLNFEDGRPVNVVEVEFDPSKVNEQQLAEKVHSIMDGMYTVKSIEVKNFHGLKQSAGAASGTEMSTYDLSPLMKALDLLRMVSRLVE
ncbi:MAG: heavy-metal-associated domain-containing protein [Flavobacteriales bacterium]|nr:heavy-metal-associated domain-containing protein [Flavobacteriales bacterium]